MSVAKRRIEEELELNMAEAARIAKKLELNMAEATRIAQERQRPEVHWVPQSDLTAPTLYPCVILNGRVVGEITQEEMDVLKVAKARDNRSSEILDILYGRLLKANAAIAAARKGGE